MTRPSPTILGRAIEGRYAGLVDEKVGVLVRSLTVRGNR
jgi:hypothetical protein